MQSLARITEHQDFIESLNNIIFGESVHESSKEDFSIPVNLKVSTTTSIDDQVKSSELYLKENYQNRLIQLIYQDSFYPDEINDTISFVRKLMDAYGNTVMTNWFAGLYNEFVGDSVVLKGLLYIILYYSDCFGDLLELTSQAAIVNKSKEINELGVRILESQCNLKHYNILCNLKDMEPWLQSYIDKVKSDFKRELCHT